MAQGDEDTGEQKPPPANSDNPVQPYKEGDDTFLAGVAGGFEFNSQITRHEFTSPYPPPQFVAQYEEILPGSGERLLAMVEREQAHAHQMAREESERANKQLADSTVLQKRGQLFAFILGMTGMVVGGILIFTDHEGWGFGTLFSSIAVLALAFGASKYFDYKNAQELLKYSIEDE